MTEADPAKLLGSVVQVKLDDQVVAVGVLLAYASDGEVVLVAEDGAIHHCWPMLSIEAAP